MIIKNKIKKHGGDWRARGNIKNVFIDEMHPIFK